jgi:hypothetical protein
VDVFFVDWEKPRAHADGQLHGKILPPWSFLLPLHSRGCPAIAEVKDSSDHSTHNVSIWRRLFVANKWNDIQARPALPVAASCCVLICVALGRLLRVRVWWT